MSYKMIWIRNPGTFTDPKCSVKIFTDKINVARTGRTPSEALEQLVIDYPDIFGVKFEDPSREKSYIGSGDGNCRAVPAGEDAEQHTKDNVSTVRRHNSHDD